MSNLETMAAQIAALLEASGLSPAEARARAAEGVAGLESAAPGSGWGVLDTSTDVGAALDADIQEAEARARAALDVDPESVRHMPGAQEVAPGVFLVPSRETETLADVLDLDTWEETRGEHRRDEKDVN